MPFVPLLGGAYTAPALIASAQRCVNLYPEATPKGTYAPTMHRPTPGLRPLGTPPSASGWRGLYRASNRALYGVCGAGVYRVHEDWTTQLLGSIPYRTTMVSMADNKNTLVLVDGGEGTGWTIDLSNDAFAQIVDPAFYGADYVAHTDTYFVWNKPNSNQFYVSSSNIVTPLDPLYFASKESRSDRLAAVMVNHRELWLLGEQTSEGWFLSGAAAFPFAILSGVFVEHGVLAKYSVAQIDLTVFFLGRDVNGQGVVVALSQYKANRISNHALEAELRTYSRLDDAVAYAYQQDGHAFYVLNFPTADKTWVFDMSTGEWHERVWIDDDGLEHRHRGQCFANAYNTLVVGDWENGQLYALDASVYTDNGQPIKRVRGFPHIVVNAEWVEYHGFQADVSVGQVDLGDEIFLRWSDDRGQTWCDPLGAPMGPRGEYAVRPMWIGGLGTSPFRTFELSWSGAGNVSLNGAFVDATPTGGQ